MSFTNHDNDIKITETQLNVFVGIENGLCYDPDIDKGNAELLKAF